MRGNTHRADPHRFEQFEPTMFKQDGHHLTGLCVDQRDSETEFALKLTQTLCALAHFTHMHAHKHTCTHKEHLFPATTSSFPCTESCLGCRVAIAVCRTRCHTPSYIFRLFICFTSGHFCGCYSIPLETD